MSPGDILHQSTLPKGEVCTTHVVAPNLAIGPAIHFEATRAKGWITLLVAKECVEGAPCKVRLADSGGNEIFRVCAAIEVASLWLELGKQVVIACGAGRSRAAACAAGVMVYRGVAADLDHAVGMIKAARPEANPNAGILGDVKMALQILTGDVHA